MVVSKRGERKRMGEWKIERANVSREFYVSEILILTDLSISTDIENK